MLAKKGEYAKARFNYFQAADLDRSKQFESFSSVASLYMRSADLCKGNVSRLSDRACYLAAYDLYEAVGNRKGMEIAAAQFPSMVDIFQDDYSVGDRFQVGCWINEETRIRKRP
jgi:hypothetical protein